MQAVRIVAIYREEIYSNRAIDADKAIMDALIERLKASLGVRGEFLLLKPEKGLDSLLSLDIDLVVTMAQSSASLQLLDQLEKRGVKIINSSLSINNCMRQTLSELLRANNVSYPKYQESPVSELTSLGIDWSTGYWIKRGDFHAVDDDDVIYCESLASVKQIAKQFHKRKVDRVIVQEHKRGELFKFYGVKDAFLSLRYIGKIGNSRFDLESGNQDCEFDRKQIETDIHRAANHLQLDFFGGDFIVDEKGDCHFIDFNDWPSFRTCREQVSLVMANYIQRKMGWI